MSSAATATAQTLYGDVSQYDDPAPRLLVHQPPSVSGMANGEEEEEKEGRRSGRERGGGEAAAMQEAGAGGIVCVDACATPVRGCLSSCLPGQGVVPWSVSRAAAV